MVAFRRLLRHQRDGIDARPASLQGGHAGADGRRLDHRAAAGVDRIEFALGAPRVREHAARELVCRRATLDPPPNLLLTPRHPSFHSFP